MPHRAHDLAALPALTIADGIAVRPLFGETVMVMRADLEPGAMLPEHAHPHEQITVVLEGSLRLEIDGVGVDLGPGDAVPIPAGARHSGVAGLDGCTALDAFAPVREDLRARLSGADDE